MIICHQFINANYLFYNPNVLTKSIFISIFFSKWEEDVEILLIKLKIFGEMLIFSVKLIKNFVILF